MPASIKPGSKLLFSNTCYRIFPAIRQGFRLSRMTSNNLISPMKFCYNTNSTLPKQCQSSRSVLQDGSRTFGLFWKEKNPSYNRRNTVHEVEMKNASLSGDILILLFCKKFLFSFLSHPISSLGSLPDQIVLIC